MDKKIRFEVFKRDNFTCAYCGRTPPNIILEVDHIHPKSKKGTNDINNLVTSCFDCNRGKKDISLSTIPTALIDNLEVMKEKLEQIKIYNSYRKKLEKIEKKRIEEVSDIYTQYFEKYILNEKFKETSIKRFLKFLPLDEVKYSMHLACRKMDDDNAPQYFCGICWNKIKALNNESQKH